MNRGEEGHFHSKEDKYLVFHVNRMNTTVLVLHFDCQSVLVMTKAGPVFASLEPTRCIDAVERLLQEACAQNWGNSHFSAL